MSSRRPADATPVPGVGPREETPPGPTWLSGQEPGGSLTAPDTLVPAATAAQTTWHRSAGGPAAGAAAPVPADRLRGRYLLVGLIGQGAMGQVWRARDLLGEEAQDHSPFVAVKVLNGDIRTQPAAFIALHREAARAQRLAHPNVVATHVFDRDEPSGRAFIAMELLEGQPLDRIIRDAGTRGVPRAQAMSIVRGMARGLAYAQSKGLVHSDLKPANVFVTTDGVPKILDFGIARAVQSQGGTVERGAALDDSGLHGCTPAYAAPDVLAGAGDPSPADDVFSLGLVAYELLTGSHPFQRRSALEAEAEGIRLPTLRGLSRRESHTLARAVAFERRRRRPADAGALLRRLRRAPLLPRVQTAAVAVLILTGCRAGLSQPPRDAARPAARAAACSRAAGLPREGAARQRLAGLPAAHPRHHCQRRCRPVLRRRLPAAPQGPRGCARPQRRRRRCDPVVPAGVRQGPGP